MSLASELRRRIRAENMLRRYVPCLPRATKAPPSGPGWLHEIKHDGFRIIARRDGMRVRLMSRNGYDFSDRFPLAVRAIAVLPAVSCVIDGEAIACDESGLAVFDLIRRGEGATSSLCAFDLLELNGHDLRKRPIEERKHVLANLLRHEHPGIAFNRHFVGDGSIIYKHACALGCEGIVSKRLGSYYSAGRSGHWLKLKNPCRACGKTRGRRRLGPMTCMRATRLLLPGCIFVGSCKDKHMWSALLSSLLEKAINTTTATAPLRLSSDDVINYCFPSTATES